MLNNESIRFEKLVIFAVSELDEFREFIAFAPDGTYKEGVGHQDNREEPIFLAKFDDMSSVVPFLEDQDYVILLDGQEPVSTGRRMVYRMTPVDGTVPIGFMTRVSEEEARTGTAWSRFDNAEGVAEYWVAKPEVQSCGYKWPDDSEEKAEGFAEPTAAVNNTGLTTPMAKTRSTLEADNARGLGGKPDHDLDLVDALNMVFGAGSVHVINSAEDFDRLAGAFDEPAFGVAVGGGCGSPDTSAYRRGIDADAARVASGIVDRQHGNVPVYVPSLEGDTRGVKRPPTSCLEKYAPHHEPYAGLEEGSMLGTLGAHVDGAQIIGDGGTVISPVFGDTTAIPDPHYPYTDIPVLDADSLDARLARMSLDLDGLRNTVTILETVLRRTHPEALRRAYNGDFDVPVYDKTYMSIG